ncbi:hypothetical protein I553_9310 [Mycobacterium xenopi 4042]|uniref:3'-phosphate/5'-hydroxy nucleic acid ligase n=1 Tax=Mycobacterium xenopi 4042 TaxID=1299334 RepID=X8DXL2_MYCXE|nr:hypothetical protein I553_9310 [Mycobacterium xenopi 4042]
MISPGGVGFDISCGVRMLSADLERGEFAKVGKLVMDRLSKRIPRGAGPGAVRAPVSDEELDQVLRGGSRYVVEHGDGSQLDLDRCEDGGVFEEADPAAVSERARARDATNWAAWVRGITSWKSSMSPRCSTSRSPRLSGCAPARSA